MSQEEYLKKAEDEFQKALLAKNYLTFSSCWDRDQEAIYYILEAIFHQNKAIIELLKKKD